MTKLEQNLGGIVGMNKLPAALFVVDTKKEHNAVAEQEDLTSRSSLSLIQTAILTGVDYVIPGNDDAIRAVKHNSKDG